MLLTAVVLALLVATPTDGRAEGLDRRLPVKPGGLLQVDLDMGEEARWELVSLEVRSHDADEVWAVADLSGLGASSVKFRLEHDDRVVRLYGRADGLMSWLFGGPGVRVRIWVPREFSLDLRCASGPIRIEDVSGNVRARTSDGAIDVRDTEGDLNLRTRSGSVSVTEAVGDLAIRVADGAVDLSWVTGDVRARTENGDLRARHMNGDLALRTDWGEIEVRDVNGVANAKSEHGAIYASFTGAPSGQLETRRGSVQVLLPSHAGVDLEVRTARGTVEIDPLIEPGTNRGIDQYRRSLNGGGAPLRIYTARGNVRVGRR